MQGGRDGQKGPAAGNSPTTMPSKLQIFQKTSPPSVKFSSASFSSDRIRSQPEWTAGWMNQRIVNKGSTTHQFFTKRNPNSRFPTNPKRKKENGESRLKKCNNKQSSYCPNAEELEDSQEACNKREELQTLKTSSGARRTGPVLRLVRGPGYIPIVYRSLCPDVVPCWVPVKNRRVS